MRYSEGEMTVSALDSATSLLQAAKNLLSSVILTVKSCYVAACTTGPYKQHHTTQPPLVWRVRRSQSKHQQEELEEQQEHLEEEEIEQSLGTAFRGSIRRGNYAYQCKPIFRAQF